MSPLLYVIVLMVFSNLASDAFQNVFYISQKVANTASSSSLHMATWSNGQAIQEYKDFLATGMFLRLFLLCFDSTDMMVLLS